MQPATTDPLAPPWRGYRWPLTPAIERTAHTPAWHWPVATLLLLVLFGVLDFNQVLAVDTGPVRVYGNDIILALAGLLAVFAFVGGRRRPLAVPPPYRAVVGAAGALALLAAVMLVRDFAQTRGILGNAQALVRQMPFFLSFFLVLAFIASERDLHRLLRLWFAVAAAGTGIILLQSLRGPGDLFGGTLLDRVRVPPGPQISEVYGIFSRSNFPITFAAVWCCFFCLVGLIRRPTPAGALGVLWFSVAWVLNMSRGLYIGIALAFIACLVVMVAAGAVRPSRALLGGAVAAGALLLTGSFGLGGLNDAVVVRGASAWQDYRLNTGTWASRLEEARVYFDLKPAGEDLLLGMGYGGTRSGLARPFLEFGPVDVLYRGGLAGAAVLLVVVLIYSRAAWRAIREATGSTAVCAAVATLCSIISEIGHLPSANHFFYVYYAAVLGAGCAVMVAARAAEGAA